MFLKDSRHNLNTYALDVQIKKITFPILITALSWAFLLVQMRR